MTPKFEYSTLAHPQDIQQLASIFEQCFISGLGGEEAYINLLGVENFRIIRESEQLIGGLATLDMGQWWGGVRVPMTGIAVVGIASPCLILLCWLGRAAAGRAPGKPLLGQRALDSRLAWMRPRDLRLWRDYCW